VDAAALLALDPALAEATWRLIERSREPEAQLGAADVPASLRGLPELVLLERTGDLPPADEWPVSEALGRAAPVFALAALAALPMLVGLALLLFTQRLLVPRAPLGARLDLGAGWLAFVGGQLGFAVVGSLLVAVGAGGVTGVQVLVSSTPIALAALWAAGWRRGGDVGAAAERLGLSGSLLEAPRAFAAGLAVLPLIGVGMLVPATLLADEASHWSNPYVDLVLGGGFEQWRLLALEAGVFAPIFEELAFRGVLFAALRARLSFVPAAAASSAVFAIAHPYDLAGALAILWVGAVLCWLYERTGSLVACMVAHSAFNLFQLSAMLVLV